MTVTQCSCCVFLSMQHLKCQLAMERQSIRPLWRQCQFLKKQHVHWKGTRERDHPFSRIVLRCQSKVVHVNCLTWENAWLSMKKKMRWGRKSHIPLSLVFVGCHLSTSSSSSSSLLSSSSFSRHSDSHHLHRRRCRYQFFSPTCRSSLAAFVRGDLIFEDSLTLICTM